MGRRRGQYYGKAAPAGVGALVANAQTHHVLQRAPHVPGSARRPMFSWNVNMLLNVTYGERRSSS